MARALTTLLFVCLGLALARLCLAYVDHRWYATAEIIAGTYGRPFVYRQLAPLAVRALMVITGASVDTAGVWVLQAACIGWLAALYGLARAVLARPLALLVVCLAPLLIAPFVVGLYVYDVPSLALFTAGLALLVRGRWRGYLALFPFGVLAHESFAFLAPVFALQAHARIAPRRLYKALAYQVGTLAALKVSLAWWYRAAPGALAQSHLAEHYHYLVQYPAEHLTVLALVAVFVLAVWVLLHRRLLPAALRPAVLLIPIFFFAYLGLGYPAEVRAVIGVYPVMLLLTVAGAASVARRLTSKISLLPLRVG